MRARHRDVLEQRVGNGGLRRFQGALLAFGLTGSHHRLTHLAHHLADVGEIEVDQSRHHHEVGDAADPGIEHVVRHLEGFGEGRLLVGDPEQVLVGDDDQRIDILLQLIDPGFADAHAIQPFELERLGHYADSEDSLLAGGAGDHRRGAGSGATAHAGGDEHHVGTLELLDDLIDRFLGGGAADVGARARAEAPGDVAAQLDRPLGGGIGERLGVGVRDNEVDAVQLAFDHVVDRIAAGAADADHGDTRLKIGLRLRHAQIDRHINLR